MTDKEWLRGNAWIEMSDGSHSPVRDSSDMNAASVTYSDALEYGERCAKSAGLSARGVCRLIDLDTSYDYVECSACGNDQGWRGIHYCPNCGAEVAQ